MFLYPLAIVLIVVAVLSPLIGESKWVYGMTTVFTIIPAFFAGLEALPKIWREISWIQNILHLNKYLPLADLGLGWVVPAIVGLLLGFVISKYKLSIEKR